MANDAEERAVVTASMNAIGQGVMAGAQVKLFPATGAPRFVLGFRTGLGVIIAQFLLILLTLYLDKRDVKAQHSVDDVEVIGDKVQPIAGEKV